MKKILISALLLLANTAMAASITLFGQDINGQKGGSDATLYGIAVRGNLYKGIDGDVAATTVRTQTSNSMASRIEASVIPFTKIGSATVATRLTVGNRYIAGRNFGFYAVDPSVAVPVYKDVSVFAGYRFRSAFNDGERDTTRTARVGSAYSVTKTDTVAVAVEQMKGHSNSNAVTVVYSRRF